MTEQLEERRAEGYCGKHSGINEILKSHTDDIKDLQEDRKRLFQMLEELQKTVLTTSIQMEHGFADANRAINNLANGFAQAMKRKEEFAKEYNQTVKDLQEDIKHFKEFNWFSETMTKWKNKLPWTITGIVTILIWYIILKHYWVDIGQFLLGKIK